MPLPKIDVPTYELVLPLTKKKIKFRPFLVKEQKKLLMAMESDDSETLHNSIKDILNNCTLTEDVVIDRLPILLSYTKIVVFFYEWDNIIDWLRENLMARR
jgi:hypothetical protein